jgi:N utilization substance protein A
MSELSNTIKQICEEKGLSLEAVVATIESALAAAYRKDFGEKNQNIKVNFDIETGQSEIFDIKTVVEDMPLEEEGLAGEEVGEGKKKKDEGLETRVKAKSQKPKVKEDNAEEEKKTGDKKESVKGEDLSSESFLSSVALAKDEAQEEKRKFNPKTEIQLSDVKLIKKSAKIGDEIKTGLEAPESYGRMAAQTAKQVIIQKLREAERDMIFGEFKDKEKEVISGVVQRREGRMVLIDLGKAVGILPSEEQIYNENYKPGARIKIYVKEVRLGSKGAEVILSRTSDEILRKIFYLEIPEISNGLVELKAVAREAGARSKVAVAATSESIDPIGACVGQRGARIQTIISELGGEKVDIIEYDDSPEKFIANSLSPAKTISIEIDEKDKKATVKVAEDQLSLAIGKGGQNVRLAARLTGWRIDIIGVGAVKAEPEEAKEEEKIAGEGGEETADDSKQTAEVVEGKEDEVKEKKEKKEKKIKKKKTKKEKEDKEE